MAIEIGPLIGGIITLMYLSWLFLLRRNIAFNIAEAIFLGSAAGFSFVVGFKAVIDNAFRPLSQGNFLLIIPIILGLMLYLQLSTKTIYLARLPVSIIVGTGIGLSVRKELLAGVVANLQASMVDYSALDTAGAINAIITLGGFICAFLYFALSKEQTGAFGIITRIGRVFLMITFGALVGATMMGGVGVIGGRVRDILIGFGII
jgi:hypothetical protein